MVPYQKAPPAVVRVVVERAQPWCRARVVDGGLVKVLSVGVAHLGARIIVILPGFVLWYWLQ